MTFVVCHFYKRKFISSYTKQIYVPKSKCGQRIERTKCILLVKDYIPGTFSCAGKEVVSELPKNWIFLGLNIMPTNNIFNKFCEDWTKTV